MPTLKYDAPRGFSGSQGWIDPQVFVDPMLEGSIEVSGFHPFQGDFRTAFIQTLFADRMSLEFSHPRLLSRPLAQAVSVPGAEDAVIINFAAEQNFYTYIHTRMAVLAGGAVAVIDARARNLDRVQANAPVIAAMLESVRVLPAAIEGGAARGGRPGVQRHSAIAGLYLGSRLMWQGNPFGPVGSGTWVPGTYWYLLAADGTVHRGYRLPQVPNGDVTRFDFEAERRAAPADSGTYTVQGASVTFVMGRDTVIAELAGDGSLVIGGSRFQKMP